MAHEIQASIQYFDKVWREKRLEDIKRRSSPSSAIRELQRKRREEMMAIIDRGMADISKILEENLLQIQNHYIEPKINVEEKESLVVKETHEEECEKKREETKESDEKEVEEKGEEKENEKEKEEKNVGKFWPTITLVPSSKLVCVFKFWNSSSNIIQLPNISLCHEGNKENEETISQQLEGNYVLWKDDHVHKSQGGENPTNSINQNEEFSKVEIPCDEFYRVVFDPGGNQSTNSRSNSLEEGEYDENLIFSPYTRDNLIME